MIVVLGANGFVGSAFCRLLGERGVPFRGVDLDDYEEARGLRCDLLVNADGNSKKYLAEEDPALDFDLSVASVVRSLRDFPSRRYLYISSVAVYPDHENPSLSTEETPLDAGRQSIYGFHKRIAEQCVMRHHGDWLILRFGGLVGEGLRKGPVFDILEGRPLRMGPMSRFQFIDTADAARVALRIAESGFAREVFNVCGRGTVTLREVQEMAGRVEENELPAEAWDISTVKTHARVGLPETGATVRAFITRRLSERSG
ncbi:MAG: NAD(P)-dependent oxidoreductase [bacterium]|nr:NAD(P)-dependent oxidoreductase [bacterium]